MTKTQRAVKQRDFTRDEVEEMVKIASMAAMHGSKPALKVMDEVQVILTTDWADLSDHLKEQLALVTAGMLAS